MRSFLAVALAAALVFLASACSEPKPVSKYDPNAKGRAEAAADAGTADAARRTNRATDTRPCPSCSRMVTATDSTCPGCGAKLR